MSDCLKVFHVNIESFSSKGNELSSFLKCLKFEFDVICMTEIRSTSLGLINKEFPDFHIFIDNPTIAKGGVALLLRKDKFTQITEIDSDANFNIKNKLARTNCHVEQKWISCKIGNQNIIIGGIYRHPHRNIESFNNALKSTLENIGDNVLSIILGDININLLEENDTHVNNYLNNFFENNFIPCITLPTRITHHSATLIDHIFVKIPKKLIQNKCSSGNLIVDIADHLPKFTFIDIKTQSIKNRPHIRLFTQTKLDNFNANIQNEPSLIDHGELTDVNSSLDTLSTNYLALFDKYFPYVRMSRKAFKDKPYITSGIKVSIWRTNKLFKKYLNNPTDVIGQHGKDSEIKLVNYSKEPNNCITKNY